MAGKGQPDPGAGRGPARRVLYGRRLRLRARPCPPASGPGPSDQLHHRRRPRPHRPVPADHDPAGPPPGPRSPAGRRLRATLGDRDLLRRAQDPPTGPPRGTALEVPEAGHPGDLGSPVLPLRDPHPDDGRRRPCRPRPGPCVVRRGTTHFPALHRPAGRFSPLTATTPSGGSGVTPSASLSAGSYPRGNLASTPESSNASTPSGTSNDPATNQWPQPNRLPEQAVVI